MPVKHWSRAGLVLSYWCNARCASCYLRAGPDHEAWMSPDDALSWWAELAAAGPHGCRIHLTGGEPFGNWPLLIEICRRARREGLEALEKIETNAFWAENRREVADRLRPLDEAGMGKLTISADPYHQQYVPLARARLAAETAAEILGPDRVQVRWRDWLAEGTDTDRMTVAERSALFARYAAGRRDRWAGRAATHLAPTVELKPWNALADTSCSEPLLRSKHVHVDPFGHVHPGTCAGIVLGRAREEPIGRMWRRLFEDAGRSGPIGKLSRSGPVALARDAMADGFVPREGYAGKCHLCWHVRSWLAASGRQDHWLGPAALYASEADGLTKHSRCNDVQ